MYREKVNFQPRYRIEGSLTVETALHVGDGHASPDRIPPANGKPVLVNTVCTDHLEKAFLPGSTLKGVLLSWLQRQGIEQKHVKSVFGEVQANGHPVMGGKAEFRDATLEKPSPPLPNKTQNADGNRRNWCPQRGTCVEPRVAIDPRTKTADDQKLFHLEYVPDGSIFHVVADLPMATEEELLLLLRAFAAFNDQDDCALLGSEQSNRWGKLHWAVRKVEQIAAEDIVRWIKAGELGKLPFALHSDKVDNLQARALNAYPKTVSADRLEIKVDLQFLGALLINDPSQQRKREVGQIGHATLLRHDGNRYYLPGSSARGAFRAQAARIWRTMAQVRNPKPFDPKRGEAKNNGDQRALHPFYKLFGAPGWRAPIEIADFDIPNPPPYSQEFVAIDRFTGGSANQKKFSARGLYRPKALGTIKVDLNRLTDACGTEWQWALFLLLFSLRDLIEGDVTFGFGAGKGYGRCSAKLEFRVCGDKTVDEVLRAFPFKPPLAPDLQITLDTWYAALEKQIKDMVLPDHVQVQRRGA